MAEQRRRGGREAEYRRLLAKQARSGLSVREFAEREGMAVQTLYWWRSRLRRRGEARQDGTDFVEVSVRPSPRAGSLGSPESFEVLFPDGMQVRVPQRFDEAGLVSLLGVIRRSC